MEKNKRKFTLDGGDWLTTEERIWWDNYQRVNDRRELEEELRQKEEALRQKDEEIARKEEELARKKRLNARLAAQRAKVDEIIAQGEVDYATKKQIIQNIASIIMEELDIGLEETFEYFRVE